MEIWKHKKTGKEFIYIQDTGFDEALFVTPLGEIKSLEKSLFEEETTEEKSAVTELQERRYQEYKERRKSDARDTALLELFGRTASEMTDRDLQELSRMVTKWAKRERAKAKRYSEEDKP